MASRKTVSSRQVAVDSSSTESAHCEAEVNEASALDKVIGKVDAQQKQLDELTSMLKTLMSAKAPSEATDPKSSNQSKCFYCKKPGHVIRDCRARKRKEQVERNIHVTGEQNFTNGPEAPKPTLDRVTCIR